MASRVSIAERAGFVQRGLRLEYLTLGWNFLEAVIAVVAGFLAGSTALVGFGFDSIIECGSGAVLIWRLRTDWDAHRREQLEQAARRLVGAGFLLLAAYVAIEAASTLLTRREPEHSLPGILVAIASLIVMPLLARAKRKVAQELSSGAMRADSTQTDLCAYLSAILLGGLVLNWALGWWWADPVAGLVMVVIIAKEGIEAARGEKCACDCDMPVESDGRS